jgi:hypothetical protein
VPQNIDIWSLGCVFSIAATWVVLGYPGIGQFRKMREKAIEKINKEHPPRRPSLGESAPAPTAGDIFHNGREILPDVTRWHDVLRSALRDTDKITGRVLDLVDKRMLLGDSRERSKAKDVCTELKQILIQNQGRPRRQMPESIMKALLEVDEEAPSKGAGLIASAATPDMGQSLGIPQDRKTRKSKLLDLPLMKTTHRSEYLKSALSVQSVEQELRPPIQDSSAREDAPWQLSAPPDTERPPYASDPPGQCTPSQDAPFLQNDGTSHIHSAASIPSPPARPKAKRSRTSTCQDVFQAREEVEKRERRNLLRTTRKDELLTRHFRDRDIVSPLAVSLLSRVRLSSNIC